MRRETVEEKEVVKIEKVTTSKTVICNKCGTTQVNNNWNPPSAEEYYFSNDIHNIQLGFGYGSRFDNESWNFDLCDSCLESLVKTFKYPPDGFYEDGYSVIDDEEEKQKVFEHYKKTGEWNEFLFKSYEELVEFAKFYNVEYINEVIKEKFPDKPLLEEGE
ncbi:hypothetical protein [Heyndrickxia camelliae]|uniref:Uncharacterized protein n=1 Tax=Heyndrickxia camelliae TaxID=1707093 RepID=A0A2N3LFY9_9BACI|nr:hypothetical protein [Heyndrickxia camelliae]PKR83536.1 hypothetical protein CWO92_18395 [Heyndrickxia camelliae]